MYLNQVVTTLGKALFLSLQTSNQETFIKLGYLEAANDIFSYFASRTAFHLFMVHIFFFLKYFCHWDSSPPMLRGKYASSIMALFQAHEILYCN